MTDAPEAARPRRRRSHPAGTARAVVGGIAVSATLLGVAGFALANPAPTTTQAEAEPTTDAVAEPGPASTWPTPTTGLGPAAPPSTAAATTTAAPAPVTTPTTVRKATAATTPTTAARATPTTRRVTATTTPRTAPPRTQSS